MTRWIQLCVLALTLATGCATVQPWERELLSQPSMADSPDPEQDSFDGHLAGAREGALDPVSSGGGGCGCN